MRRIATCHCGARRFRRRPTTTGDGGRRSSGDSGRWSRAWDVPPHGCSIEDSMRSSFCECFSLLGWSGSCGSCKRGRSSWVTAKSLARGSSPATFESRTRPRCRTSTRGRTECGCIRCPSGTRRCVCSTLKGASGSSSSPVFAMKTWCCSRTLALTTGTTQNGSCLPTCAAGDAKRARGFGSNRRTSRTSAYATTIRSGVSRCSRCSRTESKPCGFCAIPRSPASSSRASRSPSRTCPFFITVCGRASRTRCSRGPDVAGRPHAPFSQSVLDLAGVAGDRVGLITTSPRFSTGWGLLSPAHASRHTPNSLSGGGVHAAARKGNSRKYSSSAASMMALLRYGAGMPLHRLERLERNLGTPLPASTQWEIVRDRVDAVVPVYDELCRRAAEGRVLHNDDTHARILELMGKRRADLEAAGKLDDPERTGLFTTGVVATTSAGPIALFFTGRKHAGENLHKLLGDRKDGLAPPIQMCDGLGRNVPKGREIIESNCLAHGRRHIVDEVGNFPAECRHVLEELGKVFKNEATCREQGLSGDERLALHQKESAPLMAELEKWMKAELEERRVEPNSGLGQAFDYLLKRWNKLTLFLRMPDAPLENNICERALKMAIRHRNNSLFYRSAHGAHVGDIYMALIYTADLHAENAFEYLTALFDNERDVAADPAAWLPWTYRATLAARGERPAA